MSRKKEIVLQEELTNQEEWDAFLGKPGLTVIDCFQNWCGERPCKGMAGLFQRLKVEFSSPLLSFATAECESIDSLENYRGNCEPCFHFYGGGELVALIRGCNAPVVERKIREMHKVCSGEAERTVITDAALASESEDNEGLLSSENENSAVQSMKKIVTVGIMKPDVVSDQNKCGKVLDMIEQNGLEIVADEEKILDADDVAKLYPEKVDTEIFEELVSFMTSGPIRVLGLTKGDTGDGVIELWRSIIGPFEPEQAKAEKPESIRAMFGSSGISNAVHGSSSSDDAARELAFFFPSFNYPKAVIPQSVQEKMTDFLPAEGEEVFPEAKPETTITIIRPEAAKLHREQILKEIKDAGFEIARQSEVTLTEEQVKMLYDSKKDEEYFDELVAQMTAGPCLVLCLAKIDAIKTWREYLGPAKNAAEEAPESMRARFESSEINPIHAADSPESVEAERSIIFKDDEEAIALIKPDAFEQAEDIVEHLKMSGFEIKQSKDISLSKRRKFI
ncbi:unnamed protein product, partial [Oikopleura dioica]